MKGRGSKVGSDIVMPGDSLGILASRRAVLLEEHTGYVSAPRSGFLMCITGATNKHSMNHCERRVSCDFQKEADG